LDVTDSSDTATGKVTPTTTRSAAASARRLAHEPAFESVEREFEAFIRKKGLKLTSQRRRILKRIFSTHRHFTAEEAHDWFRKGRDDVSRATVYRTLSLLVEGGLLDQLDLGGDKKRYEHLLGRAHHDHLLCTKCGTVVEFQEPRIETLQDEVAKANGFSITSHSLRLFGMCRNCSAAAASAGAAGR
jgi:Fur family ferric uptake transcriptional regulator